MPDTATLIKEAAEALKKVQHTQFEKLEKEIKEKLYKFDGAAELKVQMTKANAEAALVVKQLKDLADQQAAEKKALNDRVDEFEKKYGEGRGGASKRKSAGELFLENPIYKEISKNENGGFDGGSITMKSNQYLPNLIRKDLTGVSDDRGGILADSLRIPGVITQPNVSLMVTDMIPHTARTVGSVDFVRESGYTIGAAPVAESTDASPVNKPKSQITFNLVQEAMRTIAHWIPATRQVLAFANRTQLMSYVDGRLRYGLALELEDQVLLGDNTGQNLNGIVTQATAYNRGYANIQGSAPTFIDTIRRAFTQARLAEYPVTGQVITPQDWETITLSKDGDLRYIYATPGQMTGLTLWGVPVADSTRMTTGSFLIGAFSLGAELFVGMDTTVTVGREHASFFIQNMVAILAELMALVAVYRPEAFITGTFASS